MARITEHSFAQVVVSNPVDAAEVARNEASVATVSKGTQDVISTLFSVQIFLCLSLTMGFKIVHRSHSGLSLFNAQTQARLLAT